MIKKFLIAALMVLFTSCASAPKYTFTEGPFRAKSVKFPIAGVFTDKAFSVSMLFAGELPTDYVVVEFIVDEIVRGRTVTEGIRSRMFTLGGLRIPTSYYLRKQGRNRHPLDRIIESPLEGEFTAETQDPNTVHVMLKIIIREMVWKDGQYQPGRVLVKQERKVQLDCMRCTV